MIVVIVETYPHYNDYPSYLPDTKETSIENVFGPYDADTMNINDKIIELENLRKGYNSNFEIMALIKQ